MSVTTFRFDELTIDCSSRAGDETWIRLQPPGLAVDVGRGSPRLQGANPVFLTHGHLDHSLGVGSLLSIRGQAPPGGPLHIVCPAEIAPALDEMLRAAGELNGAEFQYRLEPVVAGGRVAVDRGLWMEAFASDHVVPSLGYHLVRQRHRLCEKWIGVDGGEIAWRRRAGEVVDEVFEERWLSCTGDTRATVFDHVPELFDSRILITECTFLEAAHRERATRFGHIHLDDLVERRERFANRFLVLAHLSRRHRVGELRAAVQHRLEPLVPEVLIVGESKERRPSGRR